MRELLLRTCPFCQALDSDNPFTLVTVNISAPGLGRAAMNVPVCQECAARLFSRPTRRKECCQRGHPFTPENILWRRNRPGGPLIRRCRTCNRQATAAWRAAHPGYATEKTREWRIKKREEAVLGAPEFGE